MRFAESELEDKYTLGRNFKGDPWNVNQTIEGKELTIKQLRDWE